jgi:MobA/VirD2-like, nuclease domain
MILKASQRGGAERLAAHLLNAQDNEHIEVHEVSGFVADNLPDAFQETQAIAKGTQCRQFFFSVSLNPPENVKNVSVSAFEDAAHRIEQKMGLEGQPRVIVFHEKEGGRHAHAVWSRIDAKTMTAINSRGLKRRG